MTNVLDDSEDTVFFEAVVRSDSGASMFERAMPFEAAALDDLMPPPGRAQEAATVLQRFGFTVRHIGTYSISGQGSRTLWEQTFGTEVEQSRQDVYVGRQDERRRPGGQISYLSHKADAPFT